MKIRFFAASLFALTFKGYEKYKWYVLHIGVRPDYQVYGWKLWNWNPLRWRGEQYDLFLESRGFGPLFELIR